MTRANLQRRRGMQRVRTDKVEWDPCELVAGVSMALEVVQETVVFAQGFGVLRTSTRVQWIRVQWT